jgi:hypothetical protein
MDFLVDKSHHRNQRLKHTHYRPRNIVPIGACNFLHAPICLKIRRYLSRRIQTTGIRGEVNSIDFCTIGLVAIVFLSRFPSPFRSLKSDLIAKSRLTLLSAVCQLIGLLDACDYFASRLSTAGKHHSGLVAVEVAGLLITSLIFGPVCRHFLSRLFSRDHDRIRINVQSAIPAPKQQPECLDERRLATLPQILPHEDIPVDKLDIARMAPESQRR